MVDFFAFTAWGSLGSGIELSKYECGLELTNLFPRLVFGLLRVRKRYSQYFDHHAHPQVIGNHVHDGFFICTAPGMAFQV